MSLCFENVQSTGREGKFIFFWFDPCLAMILKQNMFVKFEPKFENIFKFKRKEKNQSLLN